MMILQYVFGQNRLKEGIHENYGSINCTTQTFKGNHYAIMDPTSTMIQGKDECRWIPMDPDESPWILMDPNGSQWILMDPIFLDGSQLIQRDTD